MPGRRNSQSGRSKGKFHKGKSREVTEVVFDEDARREYLTGFHKRKQLKKEAEAKAFRERDKKRKREARQEKRKSLAEQALANARRIEAVYGGSLDLYNTNDNDTKQGYKGNDHEYEGEEHFATVTVVDDLELDEIDGSISPNENPIVGDQSDTEVQLPPPPQHSQLKNRPDLPKQRVSSKYETRAARMAARLKQRSKHNTGHLTSRHGRNSVKRRK